MPSWPIWLPHGSPPTLNHFTAPVCSSQERSAHRDSHQVIERQVEGLSHAPVSTSATSPTSLSSVRPHHDRSFSRLSLSSFVNHEERARGGEESGTNGAEIVDGLSIDPLPALSNVAQTASACVGSQPKETDIVAGKCATCDSLVRWPKRLDAFRCTICLMVNDLKYKSAESLKNDGFVHKCKVTTGGPLNSKKLKPAPRISLTRTKAIIDDCISLYLKARLGRLESEGVNGFSWPYKEYSVGANSSLISEISKPGALSVPAITTAEPGSVTFTPPIQRRTATPVPLALAKALRAGPRKSDYHDHQIESAVYPQASPARAPQDVPKTIPSNLSKHSLENRGKTTQKTGLKFSNSIFWPLEDYIAACFSDCNCLNASFLVPRSSLARATSEGTAMASHSTLHSDVWADGGTALSELDAKTLLLGDFAENGMWWTGPGLSEVGPSCEVHKKPPKRSSLDRVTLKTPRIHWGDLNDWYNAVLSAGRSWRCTLQQIQKNDSFKGFNQMQTISVQDQQNIQLDLSDACDHVRQTLLKASEHVLRRPGIPIKCPEDCRFLLLLLANPVLNPSEYKHLTPALLTRDQTSMGQWQEYHAQPASSAIRQNLTSARSSPDFRLQKGGPSTQSSIIKRILGIMSHLPDSCHHYLIAWFSRFSESHFRRTVDLIGSFVTYRLTRQHDRKRTENHNSAEELIPKVSRSGASISAQLHVALGSTGILKPISPKEELIAYSEDWQIKAAARVMSLLYAANNSSQYCRSKSVQAKSSNFAVDNAGSSACQVTYGHRQVLQTSTFYNTLLDYSDLISDFEMWETRTGRFCFCQYPMFLSIWAKIHIMNYDARRQMEIKAREAFFNSIMSRKAISQYLVLKVRRDCLVEDSLRGVSEVIGKGQEEIKKGLRIEFSNEEGIDRGGLRKEWFLLLVREVFDPDHGLFVYDEDSPYCYFNPNTFETSDQFFLLGVVIGLAIHNSTILDVALPPFAFRKLLASAPNYSGPANSSLRPVAGYSLEDLAEFRPSLAKGLGQLLDFDGDVQETFCWDFVVEVDRYGQVCRIPLCVNGENRPVNNKNRREFVHLYIHYLLDAAVARQYEPFKRGFFTICGGNALSLFQPQEIELLVRGSDEPLDVDTLRKVAIYDGWGKGNWPKEEPVIDWFWEAFASAVIKDQKKLLSFITSSDRIPAVGATSLIIKITCLGNDCGRYPIARTCFNMLGIYRYRSEEVLKTRLWRAVAESEGFGFK